MKLVWSKTGDFINLDVIHRELAEYLIEHWNKDDKNKFYIDHPLDIFKIKKQLQISLDKVNDLLSFFKIDELKIPISLDQDSLNELHERWVMLHRKHPMIGTLLEKRESNAKNYLDFINEGIHDLESIFDIDVHNRFVTSIDNKFGSKITTFDVTNINIKYQNLGRQTFDKWCNFDKSIYNEDRNDFKEFSGLININLNRPQSIDPPKQYVEWCKNNNLVPNGDKINFANFVDLENNLTSYRELFAKNFCDANNPVKFI